MCFLKRVICIALFVLAACLPGRAQQKVALSASSTDCSVANSCVSIGLYASGPPGQVDQKFGGATIAIGANASGNTIQFEASADGGATWVAMNMTPSNSTTAATSTTSTGVWQGNVAGYTNIRARMSTLSGGTTTVSVTPSTASARSGGGGGGSGTTTNQTAKGISYNSSGTATAVDASIAAPTTNGQYACGYTVTASAAVAPTCPQVGLAPDQAAGATVLYSDNNNVIYNPAAALSLPTPTTLANANFFTVIKTPGGTASTLTPVTWTVSLNGATAGASAVLPAYNSCTVNVDQVASTQWDVNCSPQSSGAAPTFTSIGLTGATSGTATITPPAVAGTITNPIALSNSISFPSGTAISWNGDTGISRGSSGAVYVGNGTASNSSGTIVAASFTGAGSQIVLGSKFTSYNLISTLGSGVPYIVAQAKLTAQSAAITPTTIYAVPNNATTGTGMYRINYVATITTVDSVSATLGGTNGFQIIFTDNNDSVVKTSNPTTPVISAVNATGTTISGSVIAYCKPNTNLQYAFGYTGSGGQMRYDLTIYVEHLN